MKGLFSGAIRTLEAAIRLRVRRQAVLAANVANVDTPGYKAKDIRFREAMERYLGLAEPDELPLAVTRPGHLPAYGENPSQGLIVESREEGTPNNVDLDQEMARLAENNLEYQAAVQALIKELELLKNAVTEGGRP